MQLNSESLVLTFAARAAAGIRGVREWAGQLFPSDSQTYIKTEIYFMTDESKLQQFEMVAPTSFVFLFLCPISWIGTELVLVQWTKYDQSDGLYCPTESVKKFSSLGTFGLCSCVGSGGHMLSNPVHKEDLQISCNKGKLCPWNADISVIIAKTLCFSSLKVSYTVIDEKNN